MPIRCPDCGRDNRDTANFCIGCGRRDLQTLVPQLSPLPPALATPAQPLVPQQPAPLALQQPAPLAPVGHTSQRPAPVWAFRAPLIEGVIEIYNQDEVYPPPERALTLMKLGIVITVLPIALSFFAGLGIALIVIIVLGGGVILAIFGAMIGAFAKLFSLLMPRRRPVDRKLTQVHLVVLEANGMQRAAVLYGDHIAGTLHKGDIIEVYGHRERGGTIRATRVEVLGAQFSPGAVMRRVVKGKRPFPAVLVAGIWLAAAAVWLTLYMPIILPLLQSR